MRKSLQVKVGKLLTDFASELKNAFTSDFTIKKSERKTTKKCRKGVRFSEEDEVKDEVKDADNHEDAHKQMSDGGILANSLTMKTSDLKGYLEDLYGPKWDMYLSTYANNGLYLSNNRKVFYNCLESVDRMLMFAVCSVCNANLNKVQCKTCSFKYCSTICLSKDLTDHERLCRMKSQELILD